MMNEKELTELLRKTEELDIEVWIDGGWGVDALVGRQTRPHNDVDIFAHKKDAAAMIKMLQADGYSEVPMEYTSQDHRVWCAPDGRTVDLHLFEYADSGTLRFDQALYPLEIFSGKGSIGGIPVRCLNSEAQLHYHQGYQHGEEDLHDVQLLCNTFGLAIPEEYKSEIDAITGNSITKPILQHIRQELKNSVDEKTQNTAQNFFKEEIKAYGVKVPVVQKIGKEFFSGIKEKPKSEIFALCEELWQSGYLEEAFIACNWSYALHKQYEATDFETFERWVRSYVDNWATCDTLCNHTIGEFVEMFPEFVSRVKEWTTSGNRWLRRAAAVTLIIPARKGLFLNDIFQIATSLLHDNDDLVQKGYGWMLKAASQAQQKEVFDFVMKHKDTMPRTALRYAIEKMPPEMRAEAMKK